MNTTKRVAVLVGSLRKESYSRQLAQALAPLAPSDLQLRIVDIGGLPLYNQDDDVDPPASFREFRQQIKDSDAVLFITPEYNRSVPGVLKNAIDVGSRPYGQSAFNGKPAAVISLSMGTLGGFGANHHLRQSLVFLNMPILQHEAYVGNAGKLFDESGAIVASSQGFMQDLLARFSAWISTTAS